MAKKRPKSSKGKSGSEQQQQPKKSKAADKYDFGKIKIIDLRNTLDVYACAADCSGVGPTSWTSSDCYTC
jgi:hypothetical protein